MIATVNNDCTAIAINTDYWGALNQSNTLTVTINDDAEYVVEIDPTNIVEYPLLPAALGLDEFPMGVYSLKLDIVQENADEVRESLCKTVLCDSHCIIIPLYKDPTTNLNRIMAYEALKAGEECVTCSCTVLQELYDIAFPESSNDCGC